jgi:glutathione S-transferase
MSDRIAFYTNPMSRGRVAHWMLEEVGAPYDLHLVNLEKGEQKQPAFLAVNPMGKVPAIVHRGVVITETSAICMYLADAFPAAKLAPPISDPARGTYLRWFFFAASSLEYALMDKAFPRAGTPHVGQLGYGTYERALETLEHALRPGPWVLGDRFSAADVYLGSQMGWALMVKNLEPRPLFVEYVARCNERPAMKRMIERNNELLEQLKTQP